MSIGEISVQNGIAPLQKAETRERNINFGTKINSGLQNDEFVSSNKPNEKVTFKEGVKLVAKGFGNKIKNMITSIVKHPVKTALTIGGTALLIAGAPVIGIASATAASMLALGFAGIAVAKTTADVIETVKDSRAGRRDEVREDLTKLGGDGVDLALSLPFLPKAINQVSRFAKYGKGTLGLNTELLSNLKNCRSLSAVKMEFAKANTLINYEMIGNELGLAVKPKIAFKDFQANAQGIVGGAYEPTTGELQINQNILTGKGKAMAKITKLGDAEVIMRHELEHFKQFADIARTENLGVDHLSNTITKYYNEMGKLCSIDDLEKVGLSKEVFENMTKGDRTAFNRKFYQDVVDSQGIIKAGTPEAEMAAKYSQGLLEKVNPSQESLDILNNALAKIDKNASLYAKSRQAAKAQNEFYRSNTLEKGAFAAQDKYVAEVVKGRPTVTKDLLMADAVINNGTNA